MSFEFPQVTPNPDSGTRVAPLPEELLAGHITELCEEIDRLEKDLKKANDITGMGWFAFFGLCAGIIVAFAIF